MKKSKLGLLTILVLVAFMVNGYASLTKMGINSHMVSCLLKPNSLETHVGLVPDPPPGGGGDDPPIPPPK
jgi:hypothetical protein